MYLKPVIAANWKLNHGPTDARAFLQRFLAQSPKQNDRTVIFFPSALTVTTVMDGLKDRPDLWVGVQNVHSEAQGAFTGENSVLMARDIGARVVLVGHSERRHVFGETDVMTTRKMALIAQARLIPMLCVGETLDEREAGRTAAVVERQLTAGLAELDDAQVAAIMLAYEPVWAIGTGRTATPDDASEIHGVLRRALASRVGDKVAAGIPILYGGSVNRGNAAQLLAAPDVDGLLVGGASLDADSWASIVRA
ncbi:MAG: triose-phosphate isomerase [Gemmatimonas sp.]|jgi:triosephosphate isomerase|uniref:triose-phosphate isomerase n=1 Tax=Gemmatimonas sp. UBA7669 TaxID=1946568 RepID=UPI0025C6C20B|nr:triose-phosphate isomerase [Gemmatimonas sp. UBA7669]MBA3918244.1 triose-phosphate isomerase [Gemmatimonas sp.]